MLTVHHINAFLVIAACAIAGALALIARQRRAGKGVAHAVALAQTLVVAQVLFGIILLAEHKRAADRLHYAYGTFALLAVFAPFMYAPEEPRARLLWFGIATLLAAALGVRAYMTAT
jgi:glucose uptake protein GlcU